MRRVIAYVDGFNLYFGMRSAFGKKYLWLDLLEMIKHYLQPDDFLNEVKYFTSKVKKTLDDPLKLERQLSYINAVESSGIRVFYGEYIVKECYCPDCNFIINECPNCQKKLEFFNEKKTDVNIASEMLADAFKDRFDVAYLISGDRDLSSPIEKVQRMFHSKKVWLKPS